MKKQQMIHALLSATMLFAPMSAQHEDFGGGCERKCFKATLCDIKDELAAASACGKVIPIRQCDIGPNGYVIAESGYYCVAEDLTINAAAISTGDGITVNDVSNVDLSLNNHTITVIGAGNAILTVGSSASNAKIHNGAIIGDNTPGQSGIVASTNDVAMYDLSLQNLGSIGTAAINVNTITAQPNSVVGYAIERCQFAGNGVGISLDADNPPLADVIIRDCAIDSSAYFGIASPGEWPAVSNVLIENCSISNSAIHGIYTTLDQNNWIIRNCLISNSGLDGMVLSSFQNLLVSNCQVYDSGANGIDVSIRVNTNVEISGCQVFNSGACALRVDNTENLIVRDCEFTNYIATTTPVVKIQDVYDGNISNCYVNSLAGLADALVLRNCHGLTLEDSGVNVLALSPQSVAPVGINLLGSVEGTVIRNCNVSGTPSIGINVGIDPLSLNNQGVIIENCTVQGAQQQGINLLEAVSCAVYDSNVFENSGDGIVTNACAQCVLRNNTVINNIGTGINDLANSTQFQVYHNFANNNGTADYSATVPLVTAYGPGLATASWFVNVSTE